MKHLYEYVLESLLLESEDKVPSNEELKKAAKKILSALADKEKLDEYVKELNSILSGKADGEDNTKLWLKALALLFSGNGDPESDTYNKYECTGKIESISVSKLFPTQSEIDITNSAKWATKDWGAKGVANMFGNKPFGASFPVPVLVYNDGNKNWIIDGHHRWSQVALINPEANLACMVIKGKETPQEFLKLTQSVIAGVVGLRGKGETLPVGKANPDNNIFGSALKGEKLKQRVIEMFTENTVNAKTVWKILMKQNKMNQKGELIEEKLGGHLKKIIDSLGTLVMNNRDKMIENNQAPEKWAEPRPVMPQSDRAGKEGEKDSKTSDEGSALNKLKGVKGLPNI